MTEMTTGTGPLLTEITGIEITTEMTTGIGPAITVITGTEITTEMTTTVLMAGVKVIVIKMMAVTEMDQMAEPEINQAMGVKTDRMETNDNYDKDKLLNAALCGVFYFKPLSIE